MKVCRCFCFSFIYSFIPSFSLPATADIRVSWLGNGFTFSGSINWETNMILSRTPLSISFNVLYLLDFLTLQGQRTVGSVMNLTCDNADRSFISSSSLCRGKVWLLSSHAHQNLYNVTKEIMSVSMTSRLFVFKYFVLWFTRT